MASARKFTKTGDDWFCFAGLWQPMSSGDGEASRCWRRSPALMSRRSTTARWWCWSGRIGSRGSTSPGRKRSCFVRCRLVHHPLIIGRKAVSRQVDILQILAGRLSGYPAILQ